MRRRRRTNRAKTQSRKPSSIKRHLTSASRHRVDHDQNRANELEIRGTLIGLTFATEKKTSFGFAQAGCSFDKRVQYGLQIEGRTANYLKYGCGRSLLFPRFFELVCPVLIMIDAVTRGRC